MVSATVRTSQFDRWIQDAINEWRCMVRQTVDPACGKKEEARVSGHELDKKAAFSLEMPR